MLDFTALPTRNKFYAGANGAKIAVIYDGEQYMLKFPAPAPKNKELSYANSCISEYIGCHIFNSVGIAAQETLLGIYRKNGAEKIVVACKDFTSPGIVLQDFASLKNTVINSGHSGYGTELSDITQAMEDQTAFPPALAQRRGSSLPAGRHRRHRTDKELRLKRPQLLWRLTDQSASTACTTQRVAWPRPVQVDSVSTRSLICGVMPVEMIERDRPSFRNA